MHNFIFELFLKLFDRIYPELITFKQIVLCPKFSYQVSCTAYTRFLGLFSASLWTDRLKDCAGLHQIFNVLSQNRILRSQFQIFFLNSINPTRQIVQGVLKLQNLEKLLLLFLYSQLSG